MVKVKVVAKVLVAMACVAAAATGADAGGGGAGLGGQAFLQCWEIEGGVNPPHLLSVNDQFTNPTFARVGRARLLCAPADGFPCSTEVDANGNPLFPECRGRVSPSLQVVDGTPDHFTCYEREADSPASRALVKLTDPMGEQTVRVAEPKLLCVGAVKECLPDPRTGETRCPIAPPPAE